MIKPIFHILCLASLVITLNSCGSTKNLQYMQGSFDTAKLANYSLPEPIIQIGDLLSITVFSDNPAFTAIYNQSAANVITGSTNANVPYAGGYLVDENGNIQMQGLGTLHIGGLTKSSLTVLLNSKLREFLQNPYYNIRFLNYKITVIGDVAKPSVYSIPSERVNILEALGLAGDLNVTARRDNVRIIREQNGKRTFGLIDLRQPDIFKSPFYQLQQNDIVYVDLSKVKAASSDQSTLTIRNIGIGATIISTIAIVISIVRK